MINRKELILFKLVHQNVGLHTPKITIKNHPI